MNIRIVRAALVAAFLTLTAALHAQVPQIINYQGRVAVGTVNFDGSRAFKFALVNAAGTTTYWSNDGTSSGGSQPTAAVTLTVTKGLYSGLLGDTSLANMTAIPNSVFANNPVGIQQFNDLGRRPTGSSRVIRGGSWNNNANNARCTNRRGGGRE